ncbi:MAG TPA: NAD(P)-binding domain-containing protein [Burkholderiales bacterium]|nr:NAD(P)-binding domain-containing protein [Burkholderiales bacterium]
MKVGILGSGGVGQDLGLGFIGLGHEVKMGSRRPDKPEIKAWLVKAGHKASAGSFGEAAAFGELAVLATAWSGVENALRLAGAENLAGKVVIDATNPLLFRPKALPGLAVSGEDSAAERVQRWLPKARVVKAFNTVNHAHMVKPSFPGGPPDMFICGDDAAAKKLVAGICRDFGWGVIDMGGLEAARLLEPLALIYIRNAIRTENWDCAFKLLRK